MLVRYRLFPLETRTFPAVRTHAVVRCRRPLWGFADEDFRGRNRNVLQWMLRLAVLLSIDGPACEKTSEAIFLERVLFSFNLKSLRRFSSVKTVVDPQHTEDL